MIDVEKNLVQKWQTTKDYYVNIYPENLEERAQIIMCLTLMKKRWYSINENETRYLSFKSIAGDAFYGN